MSLTQAGCSPITAALDSGMLSLRAATPADRAFLREVFVSTREAEFVSSGLGALQISTLLAEQFEMQDIYYRRHYPAARFDVLMKGSTAVGRLYHYWGNNELRIIDIALLPVFRGAGIGSRIMYALIGQAARLGLPAMLYVETMNPVKSLYQRLGFEKQGENGIYEQLRREAAPFDAEPMRLAGL